MTELGELSPVEQQAMLTGAEALGATTSFGVRIMATTRHEVYDVQVESLTIDTCASYLRDIVRTLTDSNTGDTLEGDEIGYVRNDETDEDYEIDLRAPGEPYSWEACQFVKELANWDPKYRTVDAIIERAKALCTVPTKVEKVSE